MKDIRDVIKQKEEELRKLRAEVTSLRVVLPLLLDTGETLPVQTATVEDQILEEGKKGWP